MQKADLVVIGGGSGGVRAARLAAEQGAKVVLAEQARLGGTCVNVGCVPKKLFFYAAGYSSDFVDAKGYGWDLGETSPKLHWDRLRDTKDVEIKRLNGIYEKNLSKAGVKVVKERATLAGSEKVTVGDEEYLAGTILVATGSKPALPPIEGYKEHASVSDDIFSLPTLPKRAAVAGAGYIAVEFASILAGMGVEVHLVHRGPTVLKNFDASIQQRLLAEMEHLGVSLLLNSTVKKLERKDKALLTTFEDSRVLETDLFLAATGRDPNVDGLGLEAAGIKIGNKGEIPVDDDYQSETKGIYALGDVIGRVALTPVAIAEAICFVSRRFGGEGASLDYGLIPTAVFSHPNVATVGLTEDEARKKHSGCECCASEFTPLRHSLSGRNEKTMVKLIFEAGGGKVLGAHMVGAEAGEIMQGIAIALAKGATKKDFDATVGIHPTTAEEFVSLR